MKLKASIFTTIIIVACSGAAFGQTIFGKKWSLAEMNGRSVGVTSAFLQIDSQKLRLTGNTGCNVMFGSAVVKGRKLLFTKIGSTKRACTAGPGAIEGEFMKVLADTNRFAVKGETLALYSGKRLLALLTSASKSPDAGNESTLGSRKWMLETMNGREASDAGKTAFVVFDPAKGSVGGDTSCNAYGGTLKVSGSKIAITEVISTMRACVEDERMGIERGFLDLLKDADNYTIEGERLTLYAGTRQLMTFRGVDKP